VVLSYKTTFSPVVTTMTQTGTDPFQFFFTISRSVILNSGGMVYYRLDAMDLTQNTSTSFPSADTSQFQAVTVNASAQAYIPDTGGQLVYPTGILSSNGLSYVNDVLSFPA